MKDSFTIDSDINSGNLHPVAPLLENEDDFLGIDWRLFDEYNGGEHVPFNAVYLESFKATTSGLGLLAESTAAGPPAHELVVGDGVNEESAPAVEYSGAPREEGRIEKAHAAQLVQTTTAENTDASIEASASDELEISKVATSPGTGRARKRRPDTLASEPSDDASTGDAFPIAPAMSLEAGIVAVMPGRGRKRRPDDNAEHDSETSKRQRWTASPANVETEHQQPGPLYAYPDFYEMPAMPGAINYAPMGAFPSAGPAGYPAYPFAGVFGTPAAFDASIGQFSMPSVAGALPDDAGVASSSNPNAIGIAMPAPAGVAYAGGIEPFPSAYHLAGAPTASFIYDSPYMAPGGAYIQASGSGNLLLPMPTQYAHGDGPNMQVANTMAPSARPVAAQQPPHASEDEDQVQAGPSSRRRKQRQRGGKKTSAEPAYAKLRGENNEQVKEEARRILRLPDSAPPSALPAPKRTLAPEHKERLKVLGPTTTGRVIDEDDAADYAACSRCKTDFGLEGELVLDKDGAMQRHVKEYHSGAACSACGMPVAARDVEAYRRHRAQCPIFCALVKREWHWVWMVHHEFVSANVGSMNAEFFVDGEKDSARNAEDAVGALKKMFEEGEIAKLLESLDKKLKRMGLDKEKPSEAQETASDGPIAGPSRPLVHEAPVAGPSGMQERKHKGN